MEDEIEPPNGSGQLTCSLGGRGHREGGAGINSIESINSTVKIEGGGGGRVVE